MGLGLRCKVLASFNLNESDSKAQVIQIEALIEKEIESLIDSGLAGNEIAGSFGVGALVEAFSSSLELFDFLGKSESFAQKHLILLPLSKATESLAPFRTCTNERYARASLSELIGHLRSRQISISLIGPDAGDLSVLDHFLVFKCNEKIASQSTTLQNQLTTQLGPKWIVRLSAQLEEPQSMTTSTINSTIASTSTLSASASTSSSSGPFSPTTQRSLSESELINRTLKHLATLSLNDRITALKSLLDPQTGTFPLHLRNQLRAAIKSATEKTIQPQAQVQSQVPIQMQAQMQGQTMLNHSHSLQSHPQQAHTHPQQPASPMRMTSLAGCFWLGTVKFIEQQRTFQFRAQFLQVDGQAVPPRASLENWPAELMLSGLLDTKKESIQAGLSAGYAFRVIVNAPDAPVASYLMTRMNHPQGTSLASLGHLACLRVSQDVLVMLRVVSMESLQMVGYLIDRRFPKPFESAKLPSQQPPQPALQSSFQVTPMPQPRQISSTLSAGMEGLNLLSLNLPPSAPKQVMRRRASVADLKIPMHARPLPPSQPLQQQQPTINRLQHQTAAPPRHIPAAQSTPAPVLTDPHVILQKLKASSTNTATSSNSAPCTPIALKLQANESSRPPKEEPFDDSFVDAWLN